MSTFDSKEASAGSTGRGDAPVAPPAESNPRIGRYEVLERVGVGGMAEVFRAIARGPGRYRRELIIKRILPHLADEPDFIQAFVEEGKILGMLNHPNIVGVYDFGQDGGRHYLALEYLDGPPLAALMKTAKDAGQQLDPGVCAYVAREVCRGLEAVHTLRDRKGRPLDVIHRDVTPSNVMTTQRGAVKLLDFGIAKMVDTAQITQHGQIKGKAGYFAPEQIKGGPIDGRVDLFALGIVLWEALTLDHLFFGEGGPMGAIYRIMELPIPPLASKRPDVPPELDAIVMRALARDPDQRFATAAEMADALDAVVRATGKGAADLGALVRDHQR